MYKYFSDSSNVLFICRCLTSISISITSIEYLFISKQFRSDGVFSWDILSSRMGYLKNFKNLDFLFGYHFTVTLLIVRLLSCISLTFTTNQMLQIFCLALLLISSLLFMYRNAYGNDGADQMNNILTISLFFAYISENQFSRNISISFIAIQSISSYQIAGIAKMFSSTWRQGDAILKIVNTKSYGNRWLYQILINCNKRTLFVICWSVIIFESLFICVLFLPYPMMISFLIAGCIFHLSIAIFMNLNTFLWSFLATYPSIIFLNHLVHNVK